MPKNSQISVDAIVLSPAMHDCLDGRLETAVSIAIEAGRSTLEYFQTNDFTVERKTDDSPVTVADKHAEQLMRKRLADLYPTDAVLGEEFGEQAGSSAYQWIVDPIDGTKSFISGVPLYSTLVGIVRDRQCLAGVIYIPALDEIVFAARGFGAWYSRQGRPASRCQVSNRLLEQGLFLTSQVDTFGKRGSQHCFERLQQKAYITRTWGDGYGYLLVATGRAEAMVDPIANPWDLAAVQPIIEESGGRFSDWKGRPTVFGGDGIGANLAAYDEVLRTISEACTERIG